MKDPLEFLKIIEFQPAFSRKSTLLDSLKDIDTQNKFSVNIQKFVHKKEDGFNVIVNATGKSKKKIVIGAHYDIWPKSGGVNDNGAAVFILLELIKRALTLSELEISIDFVFFDLEENGQKGAKYYLEQEQVSEIYCMINLDMCGIGDYVIFNETSSQDPQLSFMLKKICKDNDIHHKMLPNLPPGDEIPFQNCNIPSISIAIVPETTIPAVEHLAVTTRAKGLSWERITNSLKFMIDMIKGTPVLETMHSKNDTIETITIESMEIIYGTVGKLLIELISDKNQEI